MGKSNAFPEISKRIERGANWFLEWSFAKWVEAYKSHMLLKPTLEDTVRGRRIVDAARRLSTAYQKTAAYCRSCDIRVHPELVEQQHAALVSLRDECTRSNR